MRHAHSMPFGAECLPEGGVRFALWAPGVTTVRLHWSSATGARGEFPMERDPEGWHRLALAQAGAGDRYGFVLPGGLSVPDPASRANPDDVHGASEVVDPRAFDWQDEGWRGRPWQQAVVYELHVGTFTPEGSFDAARARLGELAALGITAVELMPLADFPGARNWGYDGVLPFAPDSRYGTPAQLKAFVQAAHAHGLMVLLDVVYNHFGPDGNYLHAYCPPFFNPAHATPWGPAINFDGAHCQPVRDFFVHNALYWIEEYRFDGLRMDAVHAIRDDSAEPIVETICRALRDGPGRQRAVHVVLENEENDARRLARDALGQPLAATAQWNDDYHHALHVALTGEHDGYYADYADRPLAALARALAEGFVYQGQGALSRGGAPRGCDGTGLPLSAFVSATLTHDQVGNRAFGDRIDALADPVLLRAARACLWLSPHTPMLFMGEEWAASTPFRFFCDFQGELAQAVVRGRRAEFSRFAAFADPAARERIPDPNDPQASFAASRLDWAERARAPHDQALAHATALLRLRQQRLVPLLGKRPRGLRWSCGDDGVVRVTWLLREADEPGAAGHDTLLHLAAHFGDTPQRGIALPGETLHADGARPDLAGWHLSRGGVCCTLEHA